MEKATIEKTSKIEVSVTVPGRMPLEIRLPLSGSTKALEELFFALAQCARGEQIEVAGGSCCWTFSQNGATTIHLLIDKGTAREKRA